ncbi:MAG: ABC transporter substrate-binding protein, partial [Chloroflexi bacterium]|nr:ABC transporter substrate-binding protein [Chloroflexota bacterium]
MYGIYDSLVTVLPDLSFSPGLAESWSVSSDGKAVTFKLKQGIKYHDGSEFTADV